jgi:hypothetical protein
MAWYRSSPENERAFCSHCGSRLAKRALGGTHVLVSAGLFEDAPGRAIVKNVWESQKPGWYDLPRVGPIRPEDFVSIALREPIESKTAQYGYALRAASNNPNPPSVMALTWIVARDAEERERIRAHSQQNVADFLSEPGFISIVTGFAGLRGFTVTAWEDEGSMKNALAKHHAVAMKELLGERFVASVWTSVWTPARINRLWVRCTACGSLEDATHNPKTCGKCGELMPDRPAFW